MKRLADDAQPLTLHERSTGDLVKLLLLRGRSP